MTQAEDKARLKQKMLGVRIRTARTQRGLEVSQVAQQMGISVDLLEQYEAGQAETNLPELEALAQICFVPATYFWANGQKNGADLQKQIMIRRKMLGVQLAQARQNAGLSAAQLAEAIQITEAEITSYEYGEKPIPFGQLEAIATRVNTSLDNLLPHSTAPAITSSTSNGMPVQEAESSSSSADAPPINQPSSASSADSETDLAWLEHLPPETKDFLADPANLLYLKLSMRLHGLSTETLRTLAEGILDITY
ncbi:MAG: helix-turn-helix transcriptional regulator [Chloroflexota bacterium]